MNYYAGLDVSMKQTFIAIVDINGKFILETQCETDPEAIATILKSKGVHLEKIGIESGCISFWLISELRKFEIMPICIESKQMATFIALKINKTDRNDARLIADAMRCNLYKEVHHKTKESIAVGLQMGSRRVLIDTRTKLKNSIRGFLKAYGVRLGTVSHKLFPEVVRNGLKSYEEGVRVSIEGLLKAYEEVCRNVQAIEDQLEIQVKNDPIIALFESIPGVGTITAMTYKAVIDNPYRFKNPRDVGAYLGLTPTQYSSGDSTKQGRISKCGSSELRTLLVECGLVILTRVTGWTKLRAWGLKLMKRSGLKKAAAAVGRKLAVIMLMMWQKGEAFVWGEKKADIAKKAHVAA